MMKKVFIISICLFAVCASFDQIYTLQQCIDSALVNNISVQQQRNQYEAQRVQFAQQKHNLFPNVSGNLSQSWAFGRATGVDNITRSQNMANTNIGLSANLVLFDGLGMKFRIDEARAEMQTSAAETEKMEADIRVNISAMYLQVLLNKELLLVADSQLETTRLKLERIDQLISEGRAAEGERYALLSQYAREQLNRTQADNNVKLSLLDLAQAMNVSYSDKMDIVAVMAEDAGTIPSNDDAYRSALLNRPEMKSAQAQLRAQESALKNAKSAYSPTVSAGVNVGSGYYYLYGAANDNFGSQLSNNFSTGVGLNLNIPIFDRMQTPNAVKQQKIRIENAKLQIEQVKQTLRKDIDQAYYNAVAALNQQQSAQKAEESARVAYDYAEQKYEAGRANSYELYDAKNTYVQAQSDYLQAKYNYLFKLKILNYYMGE